MPYLVAMYDVGFLIMIRESHHRAEVLEYCREKNYAFYVMDEKFSSKPKFRIPIVTVLKRRYDQSVAYQKFLEEVVPTKIVCHKAAHPYDTILKEANEKGIDTIILQVSTEKNFQRRPARIRTWNIAWNLHMFLLTSLGTVLDFFDIFRKEKRFGLTPAIPKKIGVFTEEEARAWALKGYDPKTIHVVGSIDFQSVYDLKQKIESDPVFKEKLLEKYGLSKNKIHIVVVLFRFYMNLSREDVLTIPEHVAVNYDVFKILREIFSPEEADIILRMSPTENRMPEVYESYKKLGVKLCFGPGTQTDEVVCLADLYVAEPLTSVNNILLPSNVPAVFFNFSKLQYMNNDADYFHIKQVIADKGKFKATLQDFKNGKLEKQYDNSKINVKSAETTIKLTGL